MDDARRYSWPTAAPGNDLALKHGAGSERRWRPLAEQIRAGIVDQAPWLNRPAFAGAIEAWSIAEAKCRLVDDWLDEHGLLTEGGDVRNAALLADRLHSRASTLRGQLGLDPLSFAKLLQTFSATPAPDDVLAALRAEGAAILTARSPRALPEAPADAEPSLTEVDE